MSYVQIQAALEKFLETLPDMPSLQTENQNYDPVHDAPYLRSIFLPAEPVAAALGTDAANRCFGLYQIAIHYPAGKGRGPALAIADQLVALFKRGLILTEDGSEVKIVRAWPESSKQGHEWFILPVTIRWQSDQPN
jgi:hypothetical protein